MKKNSFEEQIVEINKIIEELESGDIPLDTSIDKYTNAMKLISECHVMLEKAEGKIKKITIEKNNIKIEDYE